MTMSRDQPENRSEQRTSAARGDLQARLDALDAAGSEATSRAVDLILADAVRCSASDVHFEPTFRAMEIRYRLDGVMHPVAALKLIAAPNLVARLKVMAELLTYRVDIPQEGSMRHSVQQFGTDMRVSTFPTIQGEKAVVRLFDAASQTLDLEQLGLAPDLAAGLTDLLRERTGAVFLTGPSGSGKTTTIYACLRYLVRTGGSGRHIVTIEDPVEQVIEGVSQAQVRPGSEFDFARGLRSLLRQDPEVIMIGEVRDRETAAIAVEAALTGHLVITTLHAGSACGVLGRLLDMGIEPYLLTSGLKGILNQRLLRRLCEACRRPDAAVAPASEHGECPHESALAWRTAGCDRCGQTGYRGRVLVAELLTLDAPLRQAILDRADTETLEKVASSLGRKPIRTAAEQAVAQGLTTSDEVERILGPRR
jgi:type II secretory ATPase GspE/PulE/Tfp pilus assembly ATPase PilB-like protein